MIGDCAEIDVFGRKFEGRIVDETKNMFVLRVDSRRVMLPKEVSVIQVKEKEKEKGKKEIIDGKTIKKRVWEKGGIKGCQKK
jgi:RNase P/RNase MRP subunit p29